uniref:Thioredoxin domain-containing protein n=1 Tax=Plectus sambesii TaxID=2011161 RepID=A0A914X213_9BILA
MLRVRPLLRIASNSLARPGSSVLNHGLASAANVLLPKTTVSRSNNLMAKSISKRQFADKKSVGPVFSVQSQEEFDKLVIKSDKPVIVDFHAEWCGPCKALGPRLESMVASKKGSVLLAKVDIDSCADLAIHYGVQVVPTVIAFKNGQSKEKFVGMQDDRMLDGFISRLTDKK